jgi:hypothetical protein
MLGNGEIGHAALGEVDETIAPSPAYSATAEFEWTVSATPIFVWNDDGSTFEWE